MRKLEIHLTPENLIPFIYLYPACVRNPQEAEAVMVTIDVVFSVLSRDRDLIEKICAVLVTAIEKSPKEVHIVLDKYIEELVEMGRITPIEP